ncbi:LytR/AlgR family response regulator transcription factor [Croceiramulus getboli]|nr:LytTR family DNA-binding domain-containing protein [Flavobacteriaceae bacterium YJPT1-3]
MEKQSAFIVDDEQDNVDLLKHFISKYCPSVKVEGCATTRADAEKHLQKKLPDILFLDVILDEGTGFDLLEHIDYQKTQIIFVTAYDEFAIKAFKYNAVDYVLKPIEISELIMAVEHAKQKNSTKHYVKQNQLETLINAISSEKISQEFIAVPTTERIEFLKTSEIMYCAADGKYTTFYMDNGEEFVSSRNIGEYDALLDDRNFYRIHNSYLVNLNYVDNINKAAGNYCELKSGKSLPVAKRRQESLQRFLKLKD